MKTMLDFSDIVMSPEFVQPITVKRKSAGKVFQGRYTETSSTLTLLAVVSATDNKEIQMLPEGDRINESKTFHTVEQLFVTSENRGATSDIVTYNGNDYKIMTIVNSGDYGYYKSIGVAIGVSS